MKRNLLLLVVIVLLTYSLLDLNIIGITVAQLDHDVAVIGVTPFPTSVRLGEPVDITVVVENQGMNNETLDVTVYYDNNIIGTETVANLTAGNSTSLFFIWDTTNTKDEVYAAEKKDKKYTISATATIAMDEDSDDNTLTSDDKVKVISQYIAVIPESTVDPTLSKDSNYTVSIYTDYNGTDIWFWQFSITYNPLVLKGVSVTNGDLITEEKDSSAMFNAGKFNNTLGTLSLTTAWFYYEAPDEPHVTFGPGILANITFTVVGTGDSEITIIEFEAELRGYEDGQLPEIVSAYEPSPSGGHIISGYFRNTEEIVTHDVAVVSVTFSPTSVKQGEPVNVTVVVENQGTVAETFTVAAYYDTVHPNYIIAEEKTVQALGPGANTSITFIWNTTEIEGTYGIMARASTVPSETDTEDNQLGSTDAVTVEASAAGGLPTELIIIGIVAAVIIIGLVAAFAIKREKKPTLGPLPLLPV